MGQIFSI